MAAIFQATFLNGFSNGLSPEAMMVILMIKSRNYVYGNDSTQNLE